MKENIITKSIVLLLILLVGLGYFLEAYHDFKKGFNEGFKNYNLHTQQSLIINNCSL